MSTQHSTQPVHILPELLCRDSFAGDCSEYETAVSHSSRPSGLVPDKCHAPSVRHDCGILGGRCIYYRQNVWFKVLQVPRQVKREVLELWMLGPRS